MTKKRIILASNRLPVTIVSGPEGPVLSLSGGGLATALRELHGRGDGCWVGWLGDGASSDSDASHQLYQQAETKRLKAVPLSAREVSLYYDGYSNAVLWPLFHYLLDKVRLDAGKEWRAYSAVNQRFAEAIAAETRPFDTVWIHDYQLALVPALLRQLVPTARIGFFLHVPWPSSDVFRILPSRKEILAGVLGADLVGFQTDNDRQNFMQSAAEVLGADNNTNRVRWEERDVRVGVYPIGIDVDSFGRSTSDIETTVAQLRADTAGKIIVLGVDRLDYTKGVPRRLLAINRLLEREPALRERLHYIQLAVPTRETIDAYAELRRTVNELVARINSNHGSAKGAPVQLLFRSAPFDELVALYRAADVMAVTPLRDGMNLVAKEYVAARTDGLGCLVLSEFAGAASELVSALRVNPYDISTLASTIRQAMFMPESEQRVRMSELRRVVAAQSIHRWAGDFLAELDSIEPSVLPATSVASDLERSLDKLVNAEHRTLLLDYDGTLVPITDLPDLAAPDDALLALLFSLATDARTSLHVISGRSQQSIEPWLGGLPLWLHVEHGLRSRKPDGTWLPRLYERPKYFDHAARLMDGYAKRTRGTFVESKATSLAFHYRGAHPYVGSQTVAALRAELESELGPEAELLDGHKVLELRMRGVSKRLAVELALTGARANTTIFAAGDDSTDEDLFRALPAGAITVRVGRGASLAKLRVNTPEELRAMLTRMLA